MPNLKWTDVTPPDLTHPLMTAERKLRIVDSVKSDFRTWKQNRQTLEESWKEIDRQVNQYDPFYSPSDRYETGNIGPKAIGISRSKIKTPSTYTHREGLVATLIQNQFKNDLDFFDPEPLDDDARAFANDFKHYLTYVLDLMDLPTDVEIFLRTGLHYGTAIASIQWQRETYPRWRVQDTYTDDGQLIRTSQVAMETTYNAPKITVLDNYYTVIDPSDPDVKTSKLIMAKAATVQDIMATEHYAPEYRSYTWLTENAPKFSGNIDITDEQMRDETERRVNDPCEKYGDKVLVYEAWGDFYDGELTFKNYVAEVIGDTLVRFEPNTSQLPHKPFVTFRTNLSANSVYGTSVLYPVVGIQASLDTILNQYIDSNTIRTQRPWECDITALVTKRNTPNGELVLPPFSMNSVLYTNGAPALKRADVGSDPLDNSAPTIITALQGMMERATGDSELMSGGGASEYMKTGVAMQAVNAGTTRLNLYAKNLESAVENMLVIICDLLRTNAVQGDDTITYKKLDSDRPIIFDPVVFSKDFKFTMRGAAYNIVKQTQASSFLQALQLAGTNPVLQQVLNWVECARIMFEQLDIRNVGRLFLPQAIQQADALRAQQPTFSERVFSFFGNNQMKKQRETSIEQQAGGGAVQQNIDSSFGQESPFA